MYTSKEHYARDSSVLPRQIIYAGVSRWDLFRQQAPLATSLCAVAAKQSRQAPPEPCTTECIRCRPGPPETGIPVAKHSQTLTVTASASCECLAKSIPTLGSTCSRTADHNRTARLPYIEHPAKAHIRRSQHDRYMITEILLLSSYAAANTVSRVHTGVALASMHVESHWLANHASIAG